MLFLLLFFPLAESALHPNKRCMSDDCSYQLQEIVGSCFIYNTSICTQAINEVYPASFTDLTSEEKSRFVVSVLPYKAEYVDFKSPLKLKYYAVNITLSMLEKGIDRVAIKLTEETSVTKCRLFDIGNFAWDQSIPVNLFYDCFHKFKSKFKFHLEVMSFSTMEKLSYDVTIPSYKELRTVCDWKPSVVVFTGSLGQGVVTLKFSQAPPWLNVSHYSVQFTPKSEAKLETNFQVPADQNRSMLLVKFQPAFSDTFTVLISPLNVKNEGCLDTEEIVIHVGFSEYGIELTIVFYLCVVLFGICVLIFLKFLYNYIYSFGTPFEPRVLLMHAVKCPEEKKLASAFSDYLSIQYGCQVSSIYGDGLNPEKWFEKIYGNCNTIIYIISEGLYLTLDSEHYESLKVLHPYCKQLIVAENILRNEKCVPNRDFWKKKIAKVCFPYSSQNYIPARLQLGMGRCFMLPKEFNSFLCFLFGCKPGICLKHSLNSIINKVKISNEYKELIAAVEAVPFPIEQCLDSDKSNPNETKRLSSDVGEDINSLTEINSLTNSIANPREHDPQIIIKEDILCESSDSAEDSDNRRFCRGGIEDDNAHELIELVTHSGTESGFVLQQLVNQCMGWEDQENVPEYSSLLE